MNRMCKYTFVLISLVIFDQTRGFDDYDVNHDEEDYLEKYVVGSTDDLGRLFELETKLIEKLLKFIKDEKNKVSKEDVEKIQVKTLHSRFVYVLYSNHVHY